MCLKSFNLLISIFTGSSFLFTDKEELLSFWCACTPLFCCSSSFIFSSIYLLVTSTNPFSFFAIYSFSSFASFSKLNKKLSIVLLCIPLALTASEAAFPVGVKTCISISLPSFSKLSLNASNNVVLPTPALPCIAINCSLLVKIPTTASLCSFVRLKPFPCS